MITLPGRVETTIGSGQSLRRNGRVRPTLLRHERKRIFVLRSLSVYFIYKFILNLSLMCYGLYRSKIIFY